MQVPAVLVATCLGPHAYAMAASRGLYDNADPRGFCEAVSRDTRLDEGTRQRILRAEGAARNGLETVGFFASGVVAGHVAGVAPAAFDALALGYLAARLAYMAFHVWLPETCAAAGGRSAVWLAGVALATALWVRVGAGLLRRV